MSNPVNSAPAASQQEAAKTPESAGQNPPQEPDKGSDGQEDEPLGESGLKALHSEREFRKAAEKRANDLAAKVKEFEDANLTDQEKRDRENNDLRAINAQLTDRLNRIDACEAAGIPTSWAKRLAGSTVDELTEDAKSLVGQLGKSGHVFGIPKPDPSTGLTSHEDAGSSVSAGRDLFKNRHSKKE